MISCTVPRILQMKANHLPKRNTSIPDVPENRKKCLLTPPKEDKTMRKALRSIFAAGTAIAFVPYIPQEA